MQTPKPTPKKEYLQVIKNTNLISVDLIIFDENNNVLVGKRKNNPAINKFFVPGSRIYKSEKILDSIPRICKYELGILLENPKFRGVYEHIYNNNFVNNDFGTHYVNFAYEFHINNKTKETINSLIFLDQHSEIKWMSITDILNNNEVSLYCKTHFMKNPNNKVI